MKLQIEGLFELKEKPGPGLCIVKGCRHKHVPKKHGGNLCLCPTHRQHRWRMQNPKQASFAALRDRAKTRNIPFTLTFEHFVKVTTEAGYWDHKADDFKEYLSIDRVKAELGYEDGNIQVLTVSENVAKGNRERFLSPVVQAILARKRAQPAWQMSGPSEDGWLGGSEEPF